jgi:dTDP-4-amino-4,6-dideoxygalactose transaminase
MIEYENLNKTNKDFINEFDQKLHSFYDSGWYILGENVRKFEEEYANFCKTKYCVSVGSGLDAMIIALEVHDFENGSEIIVASNTYIATILAVIRAGLKPILVEPSIESYNIDFKKIEEKITKKTKGILITHLYGKPCQMDEIKLISKKFDLVIFEDCAQAHGAKYGGQVVGSFGIGCHSFYPTKNLGAIGDGGAITTNNQVLYQKIKAYRNYGSEKKYHNKYTGINSRLDEIQAVFLRIKLRSLDNINDKKFQLAMIYNDLLSEEIIKPIISENEKHVFHIYNVRSDKRDKIKNELLKQDIKTEIHYPVAPHNQIGYKSQINGIFPISDNIHNTTLSLPIAYFHEEKDIEKVSKAINSIL